MLIRFENSLDPDQDRQNVGPNLDPNGLTLQSVFNKYIAVQLQTGFINTFGSNRSVADYTDETATWNEIEFSVFEAIGFMYNEPVICIHPPPSQPTGDSRGIAGLMCRVITFWLSQGCKIPLARSHLWVK